MSSTTAVGRAAVQPVLDSLGYAGRVHLTGALGERIADAAQTYLGMAPEDVLHGFRQQAGLPAPGRPMTGWSRTTTQPTFGQWVSGLARLGASAGIPEASARAIELVEGYAETVGPDGDTRMSLYGYEKLVCGLVDTALYAGHGPALELLERTVGWAARTLERDRPPAHAANFAGGAITPTSHARTIEWYTLAENLHRGYLAGADTAVRDFAEVWHYDSYWDAVATPPEPGRAWDVPVWLHAYSHVNTFASAAAAYEVTGEAHYLDILRGAHEYVTSTQTYATGGYGPSEFTLPEDGSLGRSLEWRTDTAEIVCGSWAAFKLSTALLRHTGEARYADWIEQLVFSGIGAVTPVRPGGRSPYYQDYRLGIATKLPHWDDWPCCSGTYLQCVSHLPDLVYHGREDGVSVALYVPSTLTWTQDGRELTLDQRTDFPVGDETTLTLAVPSGPATFTLRLRVPPWSERFTVTVNGEATSAVVGEGGWREVRREWHDGDQVRIRLGAGLRVLPVDRWHPNRVAFAHGPVVLAQNADWTMPVSLPTPWQMVDPDAAFTRETEGLGYRPAGVGTARLPLGRMGPLADVPDRIPYRIYHDLDAPRII
ncbi:glycoside hydrolase family 127 protein [Ruania suaedae]|uniref:beta-L-arabinofuranosidase domain-containing protein n=1 Tax=Ruania suaedae TaxID=2897774 RepID=UPI001E45F15E|nr:beta-L-arabinofuranosidase domain-containing protein [Ruania suaedae]UFU03130.1 glycoside hydrolase family 127 protein [Ruania suaedae]